VTERHSTLDGSSRERLARRQADLVAALVAGSAIPEGFDETRVRATESALLRKRAGEVGTRWPTLRAQFGPEWSRAFGAWARGRAPQGSWRDGWDFARHLAASGRLHPAAALDLAVTEATHRYDGVNPPRRRWLPTVRRHPRGLVLQLGGQILRFDGRR
jgi:hypothetical protein